MSDHAWFEEHVAAYLTGGLDADERARADAHAGACKRCLATLEEARATDEEMRSLFADAQPDPALADRVIRGLRAAPRRPLGAFRTWLNAVGAVAAIALLGVVGAAVMPGLEPPQGEARATFGYGSAPEMAPAPQPDPGPGEERLKSVSKIVSETKEEALATLNREVFFTRKGELEDESKSAVGYLNADKEATKSLEPGGTPKNEYYRYENSGPPADTAATDLYFKPAQATPPEARESVVNKPQGGATAGGGGGGGGPDAERKKAYKDADVQTIQEPPPVQRKVIRSGEMEFEIDSFDSAVATITKIVAEDGGYVGTVNSEKLANGKVRGTVVVRVPPDRLDALILKLRGLGELRNQRIGSQDVTKQYTDLASELRAQRAMEERFLAIIKSGKGEIKDLIEAEKQLGLVRTRIETIEGQIRYYDNLASLSTLALTLTEKDIRAAATAVERERVTMGVETEDVEKSHRAALAAIGEAKGRVLRADLKKLTADQLHAVIQAEVPADAAGPLRDRLTQLGRVARLDVTRQQTTDAPGLSGDVRVQRAEAWFEVSLYNLSNVAPRETLHLSLAATDAEAAYKRILARVEEAGGRVVSSNFNDARNDQSSARIDFHVRTSDADAVLADARATGEVLRLTTTENPDAQNVTRSKRGFIVQIVAMGAVQPREKATLSVATVDVAAAFRALQAEVARAKGRMLEAQLNEGDRSNVTAVVDFDVRRDEEAAADRAIASIGDTLSRAVQRAPESENVIDTKVRRRVHLVAAANVPPRETVTLGLEVRDVEGSTAALVAMAGEQGGRVVEQNVARETSGRVIARIVVDVPLAKAGAAAAKARSLGDVRAQRASRDPRVPEGALTTARLDVTLSNAELIVPSGEGLGAQIRSGLSASFKAISMSVVFIVVGLCVVLPWALVLWGGWRLVRRLRSRPAAAPAQQ